MGKQTFVSLSVLSSLLVLVRASSSISAQYPTAGESLIFKNVVRDNVTGNLFIGSVNRIYVLDTDLKLLTEIITGPKEDNLNCPPDPAENCSAPHKRQLSDSHMIGLAMDHKNKVLFACSNLFYGYCMKISTDTYRILFEIHIPIVSNREAPVMFTGPGFKPNGVLYVGTTQGKGLPMHKHRVPMLAIRELHGLNIAHVDGYFASEKRILDAHLDDFPVHFIHGFTYDTFTYFLVVHKASPTDNAFCTKLIRICQHDDRFETYLEMGLECGNYTLLQDAYVGKPGKELAGKLALTLTDNVLFGAFAKSQTGGPEPGSESALCLFSMDAIIDNLWTGIKQCYVGNAYIGPSYLQAKVKCTRMSFNPSRKFCGHQGHNTPIDVSNPTRALALYPVAAPLSAVVVTTTSESRHTVAVMGTRDGRLLRGALEDAHSMSVYADEDIGAGQPVHRDMHLDATHDAVFVVTPAQVSRVGIRPDCSVHKSCDACLAARDPGCGWCTLENVCTRSQDCSQAYSDQGWLVYNSPHGCPLITAVTPQVLQYADATTTAVTLELSVFPKALQKVSLQCALQGYGHVRFSEASLNITGKQVICKPFTMLPSIPKGEVHIAMNLSLLIYSLTWVSTHISFYECGRMDRCQACAATEYPCAWCLEEGRCVSAQQPCYAGGYTSLRVRRQAAPTALALPTETPEDEEAEVLSAPEVPEAPEVRVEEVVEQAAGTRLERPETCPRVAADVAEVLSPVGVPVKVTVDAHNLRDFQKRDLKCWFGLGSGLLVNATQRYDTHKRALTVECSDTSFSFPQDAKFLDIPFDLVWDQGKKVDNPQNIHVRTFKCRLMAGSCGLCLLLDPVYNCGWCDARCTQELECTNATWTNRNATCKNAQIISFKPTSGSVNGGANITVQGTNLGKVYTDLTSVKAAGRKCTVQPFGYKPAEQFVCTTDPSNAGKRSGPIVVTINGQVEAASSAKFTYVDPILADFTPRKGPLSGGSRVLISGEHLDIGSRIDVAINGRRCPVTKRNFTHLEFETAAQETPFGYKVKVTIDGTEDNIMGEKFYYVGDPVVREVSPNTGLVSGGFTLRLRGERFDAVQRPRLLVKVNNITHKQSNCTHALRGTLLACTVPSLARYGLRPSESRPLPLHWGLLMDGVLALTNLSRHDHIGPLRIFPDPRPDPLPAGLKYKDKMRITIQGKDMLVFKNVPQLAVAVGNETCRIASVNASAVVCAPPGTPPRDLDASGSAPVKVEYGFYQREVGFLQYRSSAAGVGVVAGSVVGGVFLVVIVVLLCLLLRRDRRRRRKKTMPPPPCESRTGLIPASRASLPPSDVRYHETTRRLPSPNGPAAADEAEMVPLKSPAASSKTDTVYDEPDDGHGGEVFCVEDFLQRVKSNRLRKSITEVLIPRERLDLGDIIGRGHFGCVFGAHLRDENLAQPEKVAVKTLQAYTLGYTFNQQAAELFLKEGVTMRHFQHPHVLRLLGVCFDEEAQPMVILPYMAKGDLRTYVKDKKKNFTARQLLQLARQVAEGMAYLASLNFVHRDLAARNCMIDEEDCVKVADFGLSRDLYEKDYYSSKDLDRKGKMPIKWMALESLEDFVFTTKSDVWSFGVLLWELMMRGVTPYPDVDVFDVRNYLASGRRLHKPKYCPDNIYKIMTDCWYEEAVMRPTFTDLVNRIELMLNPPPKAPKSPASQEPQEQIYMNLSSQDPNDYLHPVDHGDGQVSFRPS